MSHDTPDAIADWAAQTKAVSSPPSPTKRYQRPHKHLSGEQLGLLVQLYQAGTPQTEIAGVLKVTDAAVSYWVNKLCYDSRDHARKLLNGSALALAQRVVRQAKPTEAIDVLERIEVLPGRQQQVGGGVTVVIGMPGQPVPIPLELAKASPFAGQITAGESETSTEG